MSTQEDNDKEFQTCLHNRISNGCRIRYLLQKELLDYCLEKATEMGFGAALFEGNIGFYSHCGFDYASKFGIRYHDLPEDADSSFFLCRELIPGYLDDVTGVYQTPQGYYVKDEDVEEFDKQFPPKEKQKLPGQLFD